MRITFARVYGTVHQAPYHHHSHDYRAPESEGEEKEKRSLGEIMLGKKEGGKTGECEYRVRDITRLKWLIEDVGT